MTAPVPAASADPDCPAPGTHAGVSRHRRRKQPACDQCRDWWRDYMRRRRAPWKAYASADGTALDALTAEEPPS